MDLSLERTLEDPTVTSPEERRRLFNQEDHYRVYGRDLKDRLAKVGFDVEIVPYMEEIPVSLQKRYSLRTPGIIVLCKKPELPRDTRAVVRPTAFSEQTFAGRLPADSPPAMSVSVLIPCFNAERWVGEAIESALRQTWPEKEVIVVDDGSQDGSLRVIESFGSRIRWETGPNRGGNVARNRLLELAQGEWLQYLDADDYLLPLKIERQLGFLREHPTCDVVYSPTLWVNWSEAGTTQEVTAIREPHDPWILLGRWWLPQTGGPLWRRQALIDVRGWKPNQPCCQEHELYLRLLQAGAEFRYFGECHAAYRHWSQNATVSKHSRAELRRRRLEIEERMEQFLESRGELTPARMQALNQARFELARGAWLEDPAEATKIVGAIKERQPGFVPEPPAARGQYRWLYQTFGFTAAERAAAYKRRLSGTAGRFWPGPNVAPLPLDEK